MTPQNKCIVIVGPTASGKSALGVQLARKFGGEIISADSRQVYRGLDIGTGKITKREMRGVPHHLLDIASPKKTVTAHEFAKKARREIERIRSDGRLPIIVGGTGFYIDALLGRLSLPDVPPNKELRARLHAKSTSQLFALLKKKDASRAKRMDTPSERNNKVRLIRAIEIASSKRTPTKKEGASPDLTALWIGVRPSERELERKILTRLQTRIRQGMIAEGRKLHVEGLSYKRMEELGLEYRSLSRLLQKKISRAEFEQELARDIRRYAKRQIVYWKRNPDIRWYDPKQGKKIERAVAVWLKLG